MNKKTSLTKLFAMLVTVVFIGLLAGNTDPTPAAPVGGNTGTTLGQQRLIAFQHAVDIWSQRLDSTVPIFINAQFPPLAPNVLGSAGPVSVVRDFPNAPRAGTWYHVALANKL